MELSSRIARPFGLIEDGLGFFFANLLTLPIGMTVVASFDWSEPNVSVLWRLAIIAIAIGWICLDLPYLLRLWRAIFRGPRPAALTAARNQWRVPMVLRPLVGMWWLAHFCAGVAAAIVMHGVKPAQPGGEAGVRILTIFMATSFGFAANGYLLSAVCTMTSNESVRLKVWRSRAWVDIALAILVLFISWR
jgi:hypothetical protein